MRLYIPRHHKNQHHILNYVWRETKRGNNGQLDWPTFTRLSKELRLTPREVERGVYALVDKKYINVSKANGREDVVTTSPAAEVPVMIEQILDDGWELAKTNMLKWLQVWSILVATLISLTSFAMNIWTTSANSKAIEELKLEIVRLRQEKAQTSRSTPDK
ncbi:hypothetical protein F0P96_16000 [Hymenobacter busanensis]|uniref:Uncharacterized protein n=1 Tax=Hymenobacter busanensis TaxID=2607656 RepID=A0A7L4ZSU9_9BACT|nr:hypothetical protein [Hymenobacter busanensis]KAA9327484.1 hypothetical protein F0P96_16000 [Hymenobacter busanensis]QHJ06178.1 hypothetical protein GUY19_02235 [Hymenobacter busanensis]